MSRFFSLTIFAALIAIVSFGCTSSDAPVADTDASAEHADHDGHDHPHGDHDGTETLAVGKICGGCGEAKGSESCCSDSAEKCSCGMNKGSLLCCVELDEAAAGKDLCGKCGQVAGGDSCCAEDAEKCSCGMAKGSPLCCKLSEKES